MLVIEVKGWRVGDILAADDHTVQVAECGRAVRKVHPLRQARDYMFALMDRCRAHPAIGPLLRPEGFHENRFLFPFGYFALLSNVTEAQLKNHPAGDLTAVFPTHRVLPRDALLELEGCQSAQDLHEALRPFISDATVRGGSLKMLTILDEHTRECHVLRPERALRAADVLAWLERAIQEHSAPVFLRSDNGPEFIAKEVRRWLAANQIKTIYIDPGSHWQNGFVESFHGRFHDKCLNQEVLWILTEACVAAADYRHHYNHSRPHGKLGYQSPARFAAQTLPPASLVGAGQHHPTQLQANQPAEWLEKAGLAKLKINSRTPFW